MDRFELLAARWVLTAMAAPGKTRTERDQTSTRQGTQRSSRSTAVWVVGFVAVMVMIGGVTTRSWWDRLFVEAETPAGEHVSTADRGASDPGPLVSAAGERGDVQREAVLPVDLKATWSKKDDPAAEGWSTEVLGSKAGKVLKQLGKLILHPEKIDGAHLRPLVTDDFSCQSLLPGRMQVAFEDDALVVHRPGDGPAAVPAKGTGLLRGPDGLAVALRALGEPFRGYGDARFKFKLFHLETSGSDALTGQYFAISGRGPEGMVEQNAKWDVRWRLDDGDGVPKIRSISVSDFEQVVARHATGPLFSECTESVLGANRSYRRQLLYGFNHWLERLQDTRYYTTLGNPGVALGDVNGDGLDDLYLCQEVNLPNLLFLQQADGTLVDASRQWDVDWLESSRSALLIDLDNDGDQDLVVAILGGVVVASNEQQRFQIRTVLPTCDDTMSLAATDYDNDGDLDIYICVDYRSDRFSGTRDVSLDAGASNRTYYDANAAGRNTLFRNDLTGAGDWQFTDVTDEVGLDRNNRRFSLAASWDDFDNDGDQDLYVGNDFGRNNLFRNDADPARPGSAKFVDVAKEVGVEDNGSGMSVAWGDVDRDGQMDIYVGCMFSSAGGRITPQARFQEDAAKTVKARLKHFARGSTMFRNVGDGQFDDVSLPTAVTVGRWAWSSNFVDINNDGWEDLVVANGYVTADDSGDL